MLTKYCSTFLAINNSMILTLTCERYKILGGGGDKTPEPPPDLGGVSLFRAMWGVALTPGVYREPEKESS